MIVDLAQLGLQTVEPSRLRDVRCCLGSVHPLAFRGRVSLHHHQPRRSYARRCPWLARSPPQGHCHLDSFRPSKERSRLVIVDPQRDVLAKEWAKGCGIEIFKWFEILDIGRKNLAAHTPPKLDSIHSFCLHLGHHRQPQGCHHHRRHGWLRHHRHGVHQARLVHTSSRTSPPRTSTRVSARLPCSAPVVVSATFAVTHQTLGGYGHSQARHVPSVPRVLNRIAALVQAQAAAPGLKGALLRKALAAKIATHDKDAVR